MTWRGLRSLWAATLVLSVQTAGAQIITTIAGTSWSFPTTPLPAANAPLGQINSVALDGTGNIYVADTDNNMVFRIDRNAAVMVAAGNGIAGFSGDGGPAQNAALSGPEGVWLDTAGSLYIADSANGRIRKVSNGIITTVAGGGTASPGDGGSALGASLSFPRAVTTDTAGNLYIAEGPAHRVRKVSQGVITTVAGNGSAGFSGDGGLATAASLNLPAGVAIDAAGSLYVSDSNNRRVRKVSNGIITTFVTGIDFPQGLFASADGSLYIAASADSSILVVSGGKTTTVAGSGVKGFAGDGGPAASASLSLPGAVALDSAGNIYIADTINERVRKVTGGVISTLAGNGKFKFRGDSGPAVTASFNSPGPIALDAAGNLYIGDSGNNRIRRISAGTVTTIAGNGNPGVTGNGGPATAASIDGVFGIAVDSANNVYYSTTDRVERVSNGTLQTFAGNNVDGFLHAGYTGDGGPANMALLSSPQGLTFDPGGNLYIADSGNLRVREVHPDNTITTAAGSGPFGPGAAGSFSGDGGTATKATLNGPTGLTADSAGSFYIADELNNRVRKVTGGVISTIGGNGDPGYTAPIAALTPALSIALTPAALAVDNSGSLLIADVYNRVSKLSAGLLTTIAGTGAYGFAGDGGLATKATLFGPDGVAVDAQGNIYISDTLNDRIREILALPPFFPDPGSTLSLTARAQGKTATETVSVTATINASSGVPVPGMAYTAAVTSGGSWLSVSPLSGSTPGLLTITADPSNLTPGNYTGTIVLAVPMANPSSRSISVQFTVTSAVPPALSLDQSHISFTYATTSTARSQTLIVSNTGGGSLNFTASIVLKSDISANWLSVSPQSGTATPGNPVSLAVRADPSGLGAGTYVANLTINGGAAGSVSIPVIMTITANPLVMLLSQAGMTFTAVQNGGAIPPQTFGVLSVGSGTLSWSVQTSTLPAGGTWLRATPGSGSSSAGAASPAVTVSVNPAGLAPGVYYGLITVISTGAANTPQAVVAVLNVLPPGTDIAPIVQPASLIFTAPAGVSSPSSQNVFVYDPTGTSKSFRSGLLGVQAATLPTDATIAPAEPTRIIVQPNVSGLSPGSYRGALTLQFSDGRASAVGITFGVTGTATPSGRTQAAPRDSGASTCTPTKLIPALTTLSRAFNVSVGYPNGLSAQVMDDCGSPQTSGRVTVTFSNGDPPLGLTSLNNGTWQATWYAGPRGAGQPVKLTVTAVNAQQQLSGMTEVDGGVGPTQLQPMITTGGVVSAASPVSFTALAPGGIISIYGSLLADSAVGAATIPLPTTLGNASVIIGGQTAPLFYASPGQINAVVPFGLNTNTSYSVLVQRDLALSSPVSVDFADAQPGIFLSGGNAIVADARGTDPPFLVTPAAPARAGDVLVIYTAGLGVTDQSVVDGAASPGSPPARTQAPVTVSIGGQNANVQFAGLTPTLVGLYQINAVMPAGVTPGNSVPVILTVAGQTSPAAIIATQ